MNILEQIQLLSKRSNKAANDRLNYGGCGVFAVLLAKALIRQGYDAHIRTAQDRAARESWYDPSVSAAEFNSVVDEMVDNGYERREALRMTSSAVGGFYHVFVEVEIAGQLLHIDSDGIFDANLERAASFENGVTTVGYISVEDMAYIAFSKQTRHVVWNRMFSDDLLTRVSREFKRMLSVPKKMMTSQLTLTYK